MRYLGKVDILVCANQWTMWVVKCIREISRAGFVTNWLRFSPCSRSCSEARCAWMWRRRRRGRCASERPGGEETTAGTWGATSEAPEAPDPPWEVEWCGTAGDHHLEAAWPPNLAWAPEEAPVARERVASQTSAAEECTTCSVEVVPRSSSSTVLVNEKKSSCMNVYIGLCFIFIFLFPLCFGMWHSLSTFFVCEIDKTK